jgi:hypothetical protein
VAFTIGFSRCRFHLGLVSDNALTYSYPDMPVLDFKEIAAANAGPDRDAFELFAREFLCYRGFEVAEGPDRGPDAGRDLVVLERRTGLVGGTTIRWLVSCKHFAHSGASVGVTGEQNVRDRVEAHKCHGFMGFYSTLPSSGFTALLENKTFECVFWDSERIERELFASPDGIALARRWFPVSTARWEQANPRPVALYDGTTGLHCARCAKDLLNPPSGIIVFLTTDGPDSEVEFPYLVCDLYWCCKGDCDYALSSTRRRDGLVDSWKDIPDLVNPIGFIQMVMATMNRLRGGERHDDTAWVRYREFFLEIFQHVARNPTDDERKRMEELARFSGWMGMI